ncbi:MAG: carbon-monoxide dehydrogenase medium subunit [Rhodobacteraceae bacterium HLUCCA12]|nr:MAG: carbon-monoxide dehydrogenase medium subunit [Rhodobacteraceae bacterium HLUCCA12]
MKAAPFDYFRPASLQEAAERLSVNSDDGAMILAGGQSLVPMMALRVAYASELIDLNAIKGIDTVSRSERGIAIPPLVRHADFHSSDVAPGPLGHVLATVSRHIAHYPIRQRGTFCGSLAHADPSSEWCLIAAALDAEIELLSVSGRRRIKAKDWWAGVMETVREPEEIIVAVHLPLLPDDIQWGFYEFNRRAGDFALGMAFCCYRLTEGLITKPHVALGGIEEYPRRIPEAEAVLEGATPSAEVFGEAARTASKAVNPLEDPATPAAYRRDLSATVVRRALTSATQTKSSPALSA